MAGVTIISDSSAAIPERFVKEYGIKVVPLQVIWGGKSYRDGVDIKPTEFYTRLKNADELPTTSSVSVHDYQVMIKEILDAGNSVLILPISSGISACMDNAVQAKAFFPGAPIEVVETRLVSMALSFMVLATARAIRSGASLSEAKEVAYQSYSHIGVYFTVNDLKYLHKGGRIGSAKRYMGTALRIKPILEIRDGKIEAVESAITRRKALERLIELVEEGIAGRSPVRISAFHALDEELAQELQDKCVARFGAVEAILGEVSPVIGSHVGPGTVSIAYMAGM
jgi:DegV family protein with EDD domain